nr:MAG: hypothetical protein [Bacteriophage sp.]
MEKSEEHNALCGNATGAETAPEAGGSSTSAVEQAVAAMAAAMAGLVGQTEAAALNEAAAVLMEGGNDGDA